MNYIMHEPKLVVDKTEPPLGKNTKVYDDLSDVAQMWDIPSMPDFNQACQVSPSKQRPSDMYAFLAFLDAIYLATQVGASHFYYYETDCRFVPNWFRILQDENFSAKDSELEQGNVLVGTPVCWHPWSLGAAVSNTIIQYAAKVGSTTGITMAFEGDHYGNGISIYPNGALTLYPTDLMQRFFQRWFSAFNYPRTRPTQDLTGLALGMIPALNTAVAFDMWIGKSLVADRGAIHALESIIPAKNTYSGCGNHHVNLSFRRDMHFMRYKVAVHHLKDSECPCIP